MSSLLAETIDQALIQAGGVAALVSAVANSELITGLPPENIQVAGQSVRYREVLVRQSPARIANPGFMVTVRVVPVPAT